MEELGEGETFLLVQVNLGKGKVFPLPNSIWEEELELDSNSPPLLYRRCWVGPALSRTDLGGGAHLPHRPKWVGPALGRPALGRLPPHGPHGPVGFRLGGSSPPWRIGPPPPYGGAATLVGT